MFPLSAAATAAKSLQSCPTLCDPIDGNPPGSPVPGILQARILEWVASSFSNASKWKVKVKLLSRVQLLATPRTAAYQAPLSMGFSRQEYWSGVPLPSPFRYLQVYNKPSPNLVAWDNFDFSWFCRLTRPFLIHEAHSAGGLAGLESPKWPHHMLRDQGSWFSSIWSIILQLVRLTALLGSLRAVSCQEGEGQSCKASWGLDSTTHPSLGRASHRANT